MGRDWPACRQSKSTMEWWSTQPAAWEAHRKDTQPPEKAMPAFLNWCRKLQQHGNLVIVGYPVTYDFMFLHWYVMAFGGLQDGERCPYGFQGLDIKTLAAERMKVPYHTATKKNMPKHWFHGTPKHTHEALDDAMGQGILFVNIMLDKL